MSQSEILAMTIACIPHHLPTANYVLLLRLLFHSSHVELKKIKCSIDYQKYSIKLIETNYKRK